MDQRQNEFWVDDSDTTEFMVQDPVGLEDYVSVSAGKLIEDASDVVLLVAG